MIRIPRQDPREDLKKLGVSFHSCNTLGTPSREITSQDFLRVLAAASYGLEGTYYDQVFLEPYGRKEGLWAVHYYIYPNHIYAVVSKYLSRKVWDGRGIFLPDHPEEEEEWQWGYQVFYYQVGCLHPNVKREELPMFMKRVTCLDCGYTETFSTDG